MITIELNNSYSQIKGLTTEQHRKLREILSYDSDPTAKYFAGGRYPTKRYLLDTKGFFPTGLLYKVKEFMPTALAVDLRIRPKSLAVKFKLNLGGLKPYEDQTNAMLASEKFNRGTLSAPTGTGKSVIISLIIARLNVKTLVVVPNLELKKQLTEDLYEKFGRTPNITVLNIDSSELDTATNFDCLIIDEAHHVAASTYQKLNKKQWSNIYYRFFLTATPFRNNQEENLLFESIAGQVIFKLSYKDAVKKGYIVPVEAYYIEMPKIETEAYTWQQVYKELVVENKARNEAIGVLLEYLYEAKISTLCLVKEIKHGDILSDLVGAPFANGKDEDTRHFVGKFNKGSIPVLIGTTGILGEGVDTKPCEYVIIAGLGKAKSAFMQQVGRAVRKFGSKESAKIILIKDRSHKFTIKHFNAQCAILLEEYGIKPVKL